MPAMELSVAAVFEVGIDGVARSDSEKRADRVCTPGGDVSRPYRLWGQLDRDRTTVAHACGLVEDQRDDPNFDFRLDHLERAMCPRSSMPCRCANGAGEQNDAAGQRRSVARRLLIRLRDDGSLLRRTQGCYRLASPSRPSRPQARVPESVVEFCLAEDWLAHDGADLGPIGGWSSLDSPK
jgi:hypothetical protein